MLMKLGTMLLFSLALAACGPLVAQPPSHAGPLVVDAPAAQGELQLRQKILATQVELLRAQSARGQAEAATGALRQENAELLYQGLQGPLRELNAQLEAAKKAPDQKSDK